MGGKDKTNVNRYNGIAAKTHHFTLFQDAEKLGLQRHWHIADFVHEESAALSCFKKSLFTLGIGSGKSTLDVTEKFTFQKTFRQCSTVDGHERFVGSETLAMNGAGNQFLAGAAFTGDEYTGRGFGHLADTLFQRCNSRRVTNDASQVTGGSQTENLISCIRIVNAAAE